MQQIKTIDPKSLDMGMIGQQILAAGNDVRTVKVPLVASDAAGGAFSWQNPEPVNIIVNDILLDITTRATGACTLDIGTTAASAGTLSDNLVDGLDVHTAGGLFGMADQAGANGRTQQKLAAGKWVTGSVASGASAGLVGNAYLSYFLA